MSNSPSRPANSSGNPFGLIKFSPLITTECMPSRSATRARSRMRAPTSTPKPSSSMPSSKNCRCRPHPMPSSTRGLTGHQHPLFAKVINVGVEELLNRRAPTFARADMKHQPDATTHARVHCGPHANVLRGCRTCDRAIADRPRRARLEQLSGRRCQPESPDIRRHRRQDWRGCRTGHQRAAAANRRRSSSTSQSWTEGSRLLDSW